MRIKGYFLLEGKIICLLNSFFFYIKMVNWMNFIFFFRCYLYMILYEDLIYGFCFRNSVMVINN